MQTVQEFASPGRQLAFNNSFLEQSFEPHKMKLGEMIFFYSMGIYGN